MIHSPRRFRVILDTCDIVRSEPKREVWPESEVPKHSIFDQRHLSIHRSLDVNGRVRKPLTRQPVPKKVRKHHIPAPTEPCEVCKGKGIVVKGMDTLLVRFSSCARCNGTGEQFKFVVNATKERVKKAAVPKPLKPPKQYSFRYRQSHKSHGDLCTLCGQRADEHRSNREAVKKEREGK